jgi:hypothetical protein
LGAVAVARRLATAPRGALALILRPLLGRPVALPEALLRRYPELAEARWRVGGLPPRVGGWLLGTRTVAGITLWRTIFLAPGAPPSPALLLHELGHVRQFGRSRSFPLRYCLESLRRGYGRNSYEIEAEAFARRVLAERPAVGAGAPGGGVADAPSPGRDSPTASPAEGT